MDQILAAKYKDVNFNQETANMFADIVAAEDASCAILKYICDAYMRNEQPVTITEIEANVQVARRVRVKGENNKYHFEMRYEYMNRRMVETVINKLTYASLLKVEFMRPYKLITPTCRAGQVLSAIIKQSK